MRAHFCPTVFYHHLATADAKSRSLSSHIPLPILYTWMYPNIWARFIAHSNLTPTLCLIYGGAERLKKWVLHIKLPLWRPVLLTKLSGASRYLFFKWLIYRRTPRGDGSYPAPPQTRYTLLCPIRMVGCLQCLYLLQWRLFQTQTQTFPPLRRWRHTSHTHTSYWEVWSTSTWK